MRAAADSHHPPVPENEFSQSSRFKRASKRLIPDCENIDSCSPTSALGHGPHIPLVQRTFLQWMS